MYRYISVSEELSSPYLGRYRSFGIAAQREAAGHWQVVCKVSDVSTDPVFVDLRHERAGAAVRGKRKQALLELASGSVFLCSRRKEKFVLGY